MKVLLSILLFIITCGVSPAQDRHWTHPDFLETQYAGSIGYLSGGIGYDILRNHARVSAHFGHVPKW